MNINMDIVKQVENIEFFARCGFRDNLSLNHNYRMIRSLDSISDESIKRGWVGICREAMNDIRTGIDDKYLKEWNPLVSEIRNKIMPSISNIIDERCSETCLNGKDELISCIKANIFDVIISSSVQEYYESEFFADMLSVYKAGHIPCGWIGSRLYGKFKIY